MDYLFEAIAILFAVLFPLSFFIVFLISLLADLGDPNSVTPIEDTPHFD